MTFDEIEDCFPDGSHAAIDEDGNETGYTLVSAQWLHDFAKNIENATLREALKTHGEEAAKLQSQFDAMCALIEIRDRREEREKRFGIASAPKPE